MRRECSWCRPPHPIDGEGPISQAERLEGVSHGFCETAKAIALKQLDAAAEPAPTSAATLELEALLRRTDEPLPEVEQDEAGIALSALPAERAIRYLIYGAVLATGIWALATLLS